MAASQGCNAKRGEAGAGTIGNILPPHEEGDCRGLRLVDGLLDPAWKAEAFTPIALSYPQEAVISFFEREPVWIKEIRIAFVCSPIKHTVWI